MINRLLSTFKQLPIRISNNFRNNSTTLKQPQYKSKTMCKLNKKCQIKSTLWQLRNGKIFHKLDNKLRSNFTSDKAQDWPKNPASNTLPKASPWMRSTQELCE